MIDPTVYWTRLKASDVWEDGRQPPRRIGAEPDQNTE
jgi:hypothetical protein